MKVEIYHRPTCPDCARAKPLLERVLAEYDIEREDIDTRDDPERANGAGIMRVPTVVIDGKIALVEHFNEKQLRSELENRGARKRCLLSGRTSL